MNKIKQNINSGGVKQETTHNFNNEKGLKNAFNNNNEREKKYTNYEERKYNNKPNYKEGGRDNNKDYSKPYGGYKGKRMDGHHSKYEGGEYRGGYKGDKGDRGEKRNYHNNKYNPFENSGVPAFSNNKNDFFNNYNKHEREGEKFNNNFNQSQFHQEDYGQNNQKTGIFSNSINISNNNNSNSNTFQKDFINNNSIFSQHNNIQNDNSFNPNTTYTEKKNHYKDNNIYKKDNRDDKDENNNFNNIGGVNFSSKYPLKNKSSQPNQYNQTYKKDFKDSVPFKKKNDGYNIPITNSHIIDNIVKSQNESRKESINENKNQVLDKETPNNTPQEDLSLVKPVFSVKGSSVDEYNLQKKEKEETAAQILAQNTTTDKNKIENKSNISNTKQENISPEVQTNESQPKFYITESNKKVEIKLVNEDVSYNYFQNNSNSYF